MMITAQQYQTLMSLLQQQFPQRGTSTFINQIGTFSPNLQSTIGIIIPFTCTISKHDQHTWILDLGAIDHVFFPKFIHLIHKDRTYYYSIIKWSTNSCYSFKHSQIK